MRAVGEVMSIGKNYKEAFQKAIRSLEKDRYGLGFVKNYNQMSKEKLLNTTPRGIPSTAVIGSRRSSWENRLWPM